MARMDAAQSIVDSSNFGEMSQWFDEQSAMTKELGSEYEGLANSIAGSMTGRSSPSLTAASQQKRHSPTC